MPSYANIVKSANPKANPGGYKNTALFAPANSFLSLKMPTAAGAVIGDMVEITSAHTFTPPAGFYNWPTKTHTVTITGATTGEDGSKEMEWSAKFTILGDSASTQEQMERQLNDHNIWLFKTADCLVNDAYVQLGNECVAPSVSVEFDGKTTKEGKKEYAVTVVCKEKYFYTGTVTFAADEEDEEEEGGG